MKSYNQPWQYIKKQRHYFANKGPSSQSYDFSSSHVWMWELNYKESWVPKNWCFWTVVLEKTLEGPLDSKEIQPVHPKGNQSWIFIGGLMLKLKLQYFGHLMQGTDSLEKTLMLGKIAGRRRRERQRLRLVGWHHRLDGHEVEQALGVGDGQGGLACCSPWGHKQSDTTEQLNWIEHITMWMNLKYLYLAKEARQSIHHIIPFIWNSKEFKLNLKWLKSKQYLPIVCRINWK